MSPEARAKISTANKGRKRHHTEEQKQFLRTFWIGRKHKPETIKKMQETGRARHQADPSQIKAAVAARAGKPISQETRDKMSAARAGRSHPHTADSRAKIGAGNKGKIRTPEQRKRLSDARIAMFAKRRQTTEPPPD